MFLRIRMIAVLGSGLLGVGCATLKPPEPEPPVHALEPASTGVLAELSRDVGTRFGAAKSGFYLLPKNEDAMLWRLALIDHAQVSVDAQYFLWDNDDAGLLTMERCIEPPPTRSTWKR
jgi:putative cardiolipin synthase